MRCRAVMNGCSANFEAEARALAGFARTAIDRECAPTGSIALCCDFAERGKFAGQAIGETLTLLAVGEYQPEKALNALAEVCRDDEIFIFPPDFFGAEMAPRLAARLKGAALTAVSNVRLAAGKIQCAKKVYAQKMLAAVSPEKFPLCLSIAKGGAEAEPLGQPRKILEIDKRAAPGGEHIVRKSLRPQEKAKGLEDCEFLLAGGRGLGGADGVERLKNLAETLGADWGVSRPAAMSGWAPLSRMIGVSGAMTRPQICLSFGASGAAAFYAGLIRAQKIVAVNRDPQAPILKGADAAAVDDCLAVLDELQKLAARGNYAK